MLSFSMRRCNTVSRRCGTAAVLQASVPFCVWHANTRCVCTHWCACHHATTSSFAPPHSHTTIPPSTNTHPKFEEMYEAVEQKLTAAQREAFGTAGPVPLWYWANRDRKDVEVSLQGQKDGTYCIRDSSASPNDFALSVR